MIAVGVFILVNIILVFIFGFNFYPALFTMFKDSFREAVKKDDDPVFNLSRTIDH